MATEAEFEGECVLIREPRIAARVGAKPEGGRYVLDPLEACYLAEHGRLTVQDHTFGSLLSGLTAAEPAFLVAYLVYRDLRSRGLTAEADGVSLRIGGGRPADVLPAGEGCSVDLAQLADRASRPGRNLWGVADEEGDVTYYHAEMFDPRGDAPPLVGWGEPAPVDLVGGRALVADPAAASRLHSWHFLGKPVGSALLLSELEARWLERAGVLAGKRSPPDTEVDGPAGILETVYADLKGRGLIVKTGFKYGCHFRAYEGSPDEGHAEYLVHVTPDGWTSTWTELARAVRLAGGVRKTILLAWVRRGRVRGYIGLGRVSP